ncbi:MAG TPA: methyltransferase domain-containing protein [Chitinophagaceae bacterium]|nr:methyltransferase domain-containing protein [Chitinophagaceae bacterium]
MNNVHQYPGKELVLFEEAVAWKKYLAKKIQPFIHGTVLEVGAGLGTSTRILNDGSASSWQLLEPDQKMYAGLIEKKSSFPVNTSIYNGVITDVGQHVDTILYIDVLEHIEADAAELSLAASHLNEKGHLIVLSPAFNFLYSEFDKAIGHFRRYSKKELKKMAPASTKLVSLQYLDSLGYFASVANKIFLHQTYPSRRQLVFWDKYLIPVSEITDRLFLHSFGKSILSVWEKQ